MDKCKHCGKYKGDHRATDKHCPSSPKTRIGYIHYHPTNFYEPKDKGVNVKDGDNKIL